MNDAGHLQGLTRGQVRLAKNIQLWVMHEFDRDDRVGFELLTMDDYDAFLINDVNNVLPTLPPTPAVTSTALFSMPVASSNPVPQVQYVMAPAPVHSGFSHSVKCDVKQYPTFAGDHSAWPKFKRAVISLAVTHGLDDIFDPKFSGDPSYQVYQEKNKFVYSVWMSRIKEDKKDERGVNFKLKDIYECASNMKQVALMAMNKLSNLTMAYNTPGGVPVLIIKFRDLLNNLKDAGEPVSDIMAKS